MDGILHDEDEFKTYANAIGEDLRSGHLHISCGGSNTLVAHRSASVLWVGLLRGEDEIRTGTLATGDEIQRGHIKI